MMVMTAKVNFKKVLIALVAAVGIIIILLALFGGGKEAAPTAAPTVSNNDGRVKFLEEQGWKVSTSPTETSQVRIPAETSEVFDRYNALQKSQGYDLSQYAGKTVMRYVYKITDYPGATDPVYATLLIYKNQIVGGDVTDTSAKGVIRGLKRPADLSSLPPATVPEASTAETVPETTASIS